MFELFYLRLIVQVLAFANLPEVQGRWYSGAVLQRMRQQQLRPRVESASKLFD